MRRRRHFTSLHLFSHPFLIVPAFAGLLLSTPVAGAQTGQEGARTSATRASLDSLAGDRERLAVDHRLSAREREDMRAEAAALRERLKIGDFEEGDQLVMIVQGEAALSDTFTVRAGRILVLPNIPEVPLAGILRSELQPRLAAHLGKYIRDVVVSVTPLIRIAVLGDVRQPGFYRISAHQPISDALMAAGGPTPSSELRKSFVQRGGTELRTGRSIADALSTGLTFDEMGMRPGDAIVIGTRRNTNWQSIAQIAALVAGVAVSITAITARR